jgi:hypothetical protein
VSRLVLESNVIITVAAAAVLGWFPRLWFRPDARLRTVVQVVAWAIASCLIALNSLARPIFDDEVFYTAQAYAAQHGQVSGYLPLRVWAYYLFLALHLSPAATILATRISMILATVLAGLMVMSIARTIDRSGGFTASIAGALSALTFGNLPMGTMVPEYIAFLFLLAGIWAMLAAPARWPRAFSLFVSGFMLACACATSLRLLLFCVAAFLAVLLEPGRLTRGRAFLWTALGTVAGVFPSAFHIITRDSMASVLYWHYTFMQRIGIIQFTAPVELPAVLAIVAVAGAWVLWRARPLSGSTTLVVFWLTATVSAILNPQKLEHTLGPWLALSFVLAAATIAASLPRAPETGKQRIYVALLLLLFFNQADPNITTLKDPAGIGTTIRQADSGLRLVNWLARVANGNPVVCVPPFHPIFAPNAWEMWNVIYYCYIRDPQMNLELEPHLEETLRSKKAAVVEWDPWPGEAEAANILQYLVDRKFVAPEQVRSLAEELSRSYRLVQWIGPLPEEFGGGRFLVRRDIRIDGQVRVLDDSLILHPGTEGTP